MLPVVVPSAELQVVTLETGTLNLLRSPSTTPWMAAFRNC